MLLYYLHFKGVVFMLKIVRPICCGVDVHKRFIVASIGSTDNHGITTYQTKNFYTHNKDINSFKRWLISNNCHDVCMESTGKYWIPIFNILEDDFNVVVANPKYIKAVKGKKTDKKDSIWITDLFKHDLCPQSFIPPKSTRCLRELLRYRVKLVNMASSEKNRIQNSLTISNITLDSVLSDIFGKSASNILDYILSLDKPEDFNEEFIKTLLCKSAKTKSDDIITSIKGFCIPDSTVVKIKSSRIHLEAIQNTVSSIDKEVDRLISSEYQVYVDLAKTVPGISDNSAKVIVSEIGIDMSAFSSSKKLCNWAGLTPQNNESAGKKKSTKVSRAGVYLKPILVQCANAAIKSTKEPYFRNKYLKIRKRRGHKKAIIAIARMMLTCIYKIFQTGETFNPIDINYSDIPEAVLESKREQIIDNAIKTLSKLGIDTSILNLNPANN